MNVLLGVRPWLGQGPGRMMRDGVLLDAHGVLGSLLWLAFLAALVALIVWAITHKPKTQVPLTAPAAADSALAIARERLARGEIEPEQYVAILDALAARPQATPGHETTDAAPGA